MTLLLFCGCTKEIEEGGDSASSEEKKPVSPVKPTLVELEPVKTGKIEELLERSAPLEAEVQVQVLARTSNPAIELLVEEGMVVEQGQVLLRLDSDRQRINFEQVQSQLDRSKIEFSKQEALFERSLISDTQYQQAKFDHDQAELRARNALRELEYTDVRAPIAGTITRRMVKVGDSVNTGTPIFQITDLTSTVAIIHVPEQYLPKLKDGLKARLRSSTYPEQVFPGYVKRLSTIVDSNAGTVALVVGLEEPGVLRPGMWVDVELVLATQENALLIPKRSIVYDNDQTYAFKVFTDKEGGLRAKRYLVDPVHIDRDHIEPRQHFAMGDRVIVAGQAGLKDLAPIRELEETPEEMEEVKPEASESGSSSP